MSGFNKFIASGNAVETPKLNVSTSNVTWTRITIAVNNGKDKQADFIPCTIFGKTAEAVCNYVSKGSKLLVEGSLHQNNYQRKDGTMQYSFNVTVQKVYFLDFKPQNPVVPTASVAATSTALPFPEPPVAAPVTPVTVPAAPEQSAQSSPVLSEEQAAAGLHAILEECGDILDDEWVTL